MQFAQAQATEERHITVEAEELPSAYGKAGFDLSPLFGCSDHTSVVEVFDILSFSFGGPETGDAEKPTVH